MRIIAGKYRGRNLKSPPSLEVRPTSDRLRETLFNILAPRIEDVRFLDLCAGSGAVGIEALSRGASHATFVDRSRRCCSLISANLELCGIPKEQTHVVNSGALEFLRHTKSRLSDVWEIVFFDPPYEDDYHDVLTFFGTVGTGLLSATGEVIVEHRHKNALPENIESLARIRTVKQGESALSFYQGDH